MENEDPNTLSRSPPPLQYSYYGQKPQIPFSWEIKPGTSKHKEDDIVSSSNPIKPPPKAARGPEKKSPSSPTSSQTRSCFFNSKAQILSDDVDDAFGNGESRIYGFTDESSLMSVEDLFSPTCLSRSQSLSSATSSDRASGFHNLAKVLLRLFY